MCGDGSVGQFIGELRFRDLSWYEERDILHKQALHVRTYKTLKRFDPEERERPYLLVDCVQGSLMPTSTFLSLAVNTTFQNSCMISRALSPRRRLWCSSPIKGM